MIALDSPAVAMAAQLSIEPIDAVEAVVTYVDVTYSGSNRKEMEHSIVMQLVSAAPYIICPAPPVNVTRLIDTVSITNTSSIVPIVVTVELAHGDGHNHQIKWAPLLHNDSLHYERGHGWYKMNANGGRVA